jgi:hypothetical protein
MSKTAALLLALDGSQWLAGKGAFKADSVAALLRTATEEIAGAGEAGEAARKVLHTVNNSPADGALMLYNRARSRLFRSRDGLRWDVDVHNPIVTRGDGPNLNCYYSVESEPRADGRRMHRRAYWLKDGTRGIALLHYRLLREDQTRRSTKRPRGVTAEANAAVVAAAGSPLPWEGPRLSPLDGALAMDWLVRGVVQRRIAEAPSPLQYLNDQVASMQLGRFLLGV